MASYLLEMNPLVCWGQIHLLKVCSIPWSQRIFARVLQLFEEFPDTAYVSLDDSKEDYTSPASIQKDISRSSHYDK